MPSRSRILALGAYLPEKVLTNFDLEKMVDTNDSWIVERTGIRERHISADGQNNSDLALIASQEALQKAQLSAQDLDLIIYATVTPDRLMPSTACVLQKKLGCRNIMAFDLNAACSGWIYSLQVADSFIKTGQYKKILVVGSEVLHRFVDFKDRETCILFGDGAGAAILGVANENEDSLVYSSHMYADGSLGDLLTVPAGGSNVPGSRVENQRDFFVHMQGREIFKNAVRAMVSSSQEALKVNNLKIEDIDWVVPHQANSRIIEAVSGYLNVPMEKFVVTVGQTGNTSAASIPLALHRAIGDGRIKRGQNILLTAFGAGLTSGSVLLKY